MRKRKSNAFSREKYTGKKYRTRRALVISSCLLVLVVVGAGLAYAFLRQPPPVSQPLKAAVTPHYQPVVGDVNDPEIDDDDITVQQSIIPAFQFKTGGYTLSGIVIDAQTKKPVFGAVVWIDLPVQIGQPTGMPLHTVTDAQGVYQFIHLAQGSYTLVASRYYDIGDHHYYAEHIFTSVPLAGNRAGLALPLTPIKVPGTRTVPTGKAKNIILIDLRGFYAASLLDDQSLLSQTRNFRSFLQRARVANSVWLPYGWRPLDLYSVLTGTYPQWATYDPWPNTVPWGMPDNIDTTFWFTGGRDAHLFGQESIFDVAKSYGMQTGVVAGSDYLLSDATTRSLDYLQRSTAFNAANWLTQAEQVVRAGQNQPNGFLLYSELSPLPPGDTTSSPDAQGDDYQQSLLLADQTFGQFLSWLGQQGLLSNTVIALTTSQAEANHSFADNFYGMGSTGQGSSKQTLLALSGPSLCAGTVSANYSAFMIAPVLMHAIGLPAPVESRMPAVPFSFGAGGCSS